jgi:hypothetical protein
VSGRRKFRIAGFVLAAAGVVLGWISIRRQQTHTTAEGQRLLAQLSTSEDAQALVQLSNSPLGVRRAFLDQALSSDAAANQILRHQHALSVALSRVDFADARRLYEEVLRKRLLDASSPDVIEACMVLLVRWDLIPEISARDAGLMANRIEQRIEAEAAKGAPGRYAPAIGALAERLTPESADVLMSRLFTIAVSVAPANAHDAVQALAAVAPRASTARRRDLALALAKRLSEATGRQPVVVLAPMLAPLVADSDENEADEIASRITQRIVNEYDANDINVFLPALRAVAKKVGPQAAERDGRLILSHIEFESQPTVLLSLTQSLYSFGDRIPIEVYRSAAESLLKRIRVETNEDALTVVTASLGVLNHKATQAEFTEAANRIVELFSTAKDMMADAALADAIDAVADELQPPVAETLSSMLIARMLEERRIGPLMYIAAGLISMADEVVLPGANVLSGRLLTRLRRDSNPDALRTIAFSIAAFTNANANWNEAAAVLASRIADEDDPDDLRKLASGLYALRSKASPKYFDQAAEVIARDIGTRVKGDEIAELTASLHAMAEKAGAEPFEQAASAIVANTNQTENLELSLSRIAPKVRGPKAQELTQTLADRIAHEQDPDKLRALGNSLADFSNRPEHAAASRLMTLPDAPCQLAPAKSALLNPLCSEPSWTGIAANVLQVRIPSRDLIEPDFKQLADEDDDDAPASQVGEEEPTLSFRKLSDVVTGLGARTAIPDESETPWAAIALAVCGLALFVAGAVRRP